MKTETMHVYILKNASSLTTGAAHMMFGANMKSHVDASPDHHYLCDVVVPCITKAQIAEFAVEGIDAKTAGLYREIETLKAEKQKYLAIEHDGGPA